jgi:SAM-dependent methyltransferase
MEELAKVTLHYERSNLIGLLSNALEASGLSEGRLSSNDLARLDQFHSRGLAATVELAQALTLNDASLVLDIGSGLGGPSRYLAETYGCTVQGIDLSQSFVDAANYLAERSGLKGKVNHQCGNAISLPFSTGIFDVVSTQHVAMNIANRAALYGETSRVLRRGGHLALFDVIAVSHKPLHFPVPWAHGLKTSFLMTADEMRTELSAQGFRIVSWTDHTEVGITWFLERERERARSVEPPRLWQGAVMGPEFATATVNLRRNLSEGHAALVQAVYEKS